MASTGAEYSGLLGDVQIGQEADRLVVSPETIALGAEQKGGLSDPVILELSATTQGELDFTVGQHDSWISLSLDHGLTPASLQVRADPQGMEPGDYNGSITILAPDAKNSPVEIPVSLHVGALAPAILVNPTSLSFEMTEGGKAPADKNINIENAGGGELNWTAQALGGWFSLSPASGTGKKEIGVSVAGESLAAGSYTSAVVFSAQGAQAVTVEISLVVKAKDDGQEPPVLKEADGCAACSSNRGTAGATSLPLFFLILGLLYLRRQG